jgi:ABC-type transport system involved in multi-copper enzyme maturation permease subunit
MTPENINQGGITWGLWLAQIRAVVRLEMRKTFLSRRGLWVYLVALAPVLLFGGRAFDLMRTREDRAAIAAAHPVSQKGLMSIETGMTIQDVEARLGPPVSRRVFERRGPRSRSGNPNRSSTAWLTYTDGTNTYTYRFDDDELHGITSHDSGNFQDDSLIFATVFQFFFLRLAIFFGCVGIFTNLFRGEMIDKSLHFYLLAPIRREVLVAGKYLAGLIATVLIFCSSTALQLWMLALPWGSSGTLHNLHAWSYIGVTALACLGYGSVFLAAGLLFKNPMLTAASVLLWEAANLFLPSALKKISIIFYLQSLCPVVAPPEKDINPLLALLVSSAEPTPAALAILGLVAVTGLLLVLAGVRARSLQINYSAD